MRATDTIGFAELRFKPVRQFRQPFAQVGKFGQVLGDRCRIKIEIFAEIRPALRREIFEREKPRADQVDGSFEPFAVKAPLLPKEGYGFSRGGGSLGCA